MRSHTCSINRLDAYLMGDLAASDESDLVSHLDECRSVARRFRAARLRTLIGRKQKSFYLDYANFKQCQLTGTH